MENMNKNIPNKGFTHGGVFHADDVFSTAFLKILNPDFQVSRGFVAPEGFDGIVYDIGMGEFDHHQVDKRVRENGVPYAAFGLLWEAFGENVMCEQDAEKFDADFIQPMDLADNTGCENAISGLIADYNPAWNEESDFDTAFAKAVEFAKTILEMRFKQIIAKREAHEKVAAKVSEIKDQILYLDPLMPWKEVLVPEDVLYIIFPSNRGGYNVQGVPAVYGKTELKKAFPESWRGKTPEELQELTGFDDFNFCHASGFMAAVGSLETAWALAKMAREM